MYDIVMQPAQVPFGALLLVIILLAAAVYWWALKAAKHPDYAARKESSVDAVLQRLIDMKATPEVVDTALAKLRDVNVAAAGKAAYVDAKTAAALLEAHAKVLADQARKLRGE